MAPAIAIDHSLAWLTALAPLSAGVVDIILIQLGFFEFWWLGIFIMVSISGGLIAADRRKIREAGIDASELNSYWWLIPVYLFKRPTVAGGGYGPGMMWTALFVLSFSPSFMPGLGGVAHLDGQHIDVAAELVSYSETAGLYTATIRIEEGPLKGTELTAAGAADPLAGFSSGQDVRISGTVRADNSGRVEINPMLMVAQ